MNRAEWLERLRTAWDDADAVTRDLLRPPSARELGPVMHCDIYDGAAGDVAYLLAHPPDEAPPDPDATPVPSGDDDDRPPWEAP